MTEWLIHNELERQAAWNPSNLAVWFEGSELTYEQFNARVNRYARTLRDLGLGGGDTVVTHAKNHPDLYALFFACAKSGTTYSPVSTYQSERNIEYICSELSPDVVCYTDDEEIRDESLDTIRENSPDARFLCLDHDADTTDDSLVSISEGRSTHNPSWDLEEGVNTRHNVFWTSGTTGRPKGVVRDHKSTLHFSDPLTEHLSFDTSMRRLIHNDMMFVAPYLSEGVPTFMGGGTFYILRDFSVEGLLTAIEKHGITDVHISFTKTQLLLEQVERESKSIEIPRVQAALPDPEVAAKLYEIAGTLFHSYATTESGRPVATEVEPPFETRPPIGKPGRSADVRLVTSGDRTDVPDTVPEPGEVGEMAIKGDVTMTRYLDEENQNDLVHDGWVYPGDVGRMNEAGELIFVGRKDDRIRSGGINVYPATVENALMSHPDVNEAVVVGIPDETWGERVCSLVVTDRPDDANLEAELDDHCRESADLTDEIRPKEYVFLSSSDEIPTSAVDKVDRDDVRGLFT